MASSDSFGLRRPMVVGNWKMNGASSGSRLLVSGIEDQTADLAYTDIVVCPPSPYLQTVVEALGDSRIEVGGQDLSVHADFGAYTGEVSGAMLNDCGCGYVIVGHSERRAYFLENDEFVAQKFRLAIAEGLTPILCLGELIEEREANMTDKVIGLQLDAVTDLGIDLFRNAVIAYEPVWAIGTGRTATPEQAQEVHKFIRKRLAVKDAFLAKQIRILYGGSVKADNAEELFRMPDIDGGLIGGASLSIDGFSNICAAADAVAKEAAIEAAGNRH